MSDRNGVWPGRTPNKPLAPGTSASSACTDRMRFSGVTISTVSLAMGFSVLSSEGQLMGLSAAHRLEINAPGVRHAGALARHSQTALQPLEVLRHLPHLGQGLPAH